jgi:hypothetical protein
VFTTHLEVNRSKHIIPQMKYPSPQAPLLGEGEKE